MAKEWKGNSKSANYSLAIKKGNSAEVREMDDFYATDPVALEMLLDHCSLFLNGILQSCRTDMDGRLYRRMYSTYWYGDKMITAPAIWECACGAGNLVRVLKERNYNCIYSDIKDRSMADYPLRFKGMLNVDFLQEYEYVLPRKYNVAVILTNPPYSLANEFILHALDILPESGLYIALMNINCLAGIARYEQIYRYGSLREVYVFSKRIGCWKNNMRDDKKAHIINYAWYVFQKGYKGQPTLYWL